MVGFSSAPPLKDDRPAFGPSGSYGGRHGVEFRDKRKPNPATGHTSRRLLHSGGVLCSQKAEPSVALDISTRMRGLYPSSDVASERTDAATIAAEGSRNEWFSRRNAEYPKGPTGLLAAEVATHKRRCSPILGVNPWDDNGRGAAPNNGRFVHRKTPGGGFGRVSSSQTLDRTRTATQRTVSGEWDLCPRRVR